MQVRSLHGSRGRSNGYSNALLCSVLSLGLVQHIIQVYAYQQCPHRNGYSRLLNGMLLAMLITVHYEFKILS